MLSHRKSIAFLGILLFFSQTCYTSHLGNSLLSDPVCPLDTPVFACETGDVPAYNHIYFGAKLLDLGCYGNGTFQQNISDPACCSYSPDEDCIYELNTTAGNSYYDVNNNQFALREFPTDCNSTLDYIYYDYYCINGSSIYEVCPGNVYQTGSAIYIQNQFPLGAETECYCSVEATVTSTSILVHTHQRVLAGSTNDSCDQSISISDSNGDTVYNWTCIDNTLTTETRMVADYSLLLSVSNSLTVDGGLFWIGFEATDTAAAITVVCQSNSTPSVSTTSTTSMDASSTTVSTTDSSSTIEYITNISFTTTTSTVVRTSSDTPNSSIPSSAATTMDVSTESVVTTTANSNTSVATTIDVSTTPTVTTTDVSTNPIASTTGITPTTATSTTSGEAMTINVSTTLLPNTSTDIKTTEYTTTSDVSSTSVTPKTTLDTSTSSATTTVYASTSAATTDTTINTPTASTDDSYSIIIVGTVLAGLLLVVIVALVCALVKLKQRGPRVLRENKVGIQTKACEVDEDTTAFNKKPKPEATTYTGLVDKDTFASSSTHSADTTLAVHNANVPGALPHLPVTFKQKGTNTHRKRRSKEVAIQVLPELLDICPEASDIHTDKETVILVEPLVDKKIQTIDKSAAKTSTQNNDTPSSTSGEDSINCLAKCFDNAEETEANKSQEDLNSAMRDHLVDPIDRNTNSYQQDNSLYVPDSCENEAATL